MKKLLAVTMVTAIGLFGCGGDDEPSNASNSNNTTNNSNNENNSNNSNSNNDNNVNNCEPTITECPMDACGMLDDGCGTMLDCGACACVGGQPVQAECGPCGLGRIVCSTDTEGACEVPPVLDGVACEDVLFVEAAAVGGDGSAESPFADLASAMAVAESGDVVLVAKTNVDYAEPIVLKDGVSVSGAWNRSGTWEYDTTVKAKFMVPTVSSDDTVGLLAENLSTDAIIENLEIRTENADDLFNNYGLLAVQVSNVVFREMSVRTGQGGAGTDGANGMNGGDGDDGTDGEEWLASDGICDPQFDPIASTFVPGVGGGNTMCPAANGGNGGRGRLETQAGVQSALPGSDGASGIAGGIGGVETSTTNRAGRDGAVGPSFTVSADNGMRGESGGLVMENRWVNTGDGQPGANGTAGDGGGGGGGSANTPTATGKARFYGTSGGGGGAGGCGGTGGLGGLGGGGSFALFVVTGDFDIVASEFTAGPGGLGGRGGSGGLGGAAGQGGRGVNMLCGETVITAGDGGNGTRGQQGGDGAGGAGGVSYGAYCTQTFLDLTDVTFDSLGSAQGGLGGTSGEAGGAGISEDQFRCE